MCKVPGARDSNLCQSGNPSHSSDSTGSLTCWAVGELQASTFLLYSNTIFYHQIQLCCSTGPPGQVAVSRSTPCFWRLVCPFPTRFLPCACYFLFLPMFNFCYVHKGSFKFFFISLFTYSMAAPAAYMDIPGPPEPWVWPRLQVRQHWIP